jgi:hypothetical protein
MKRLLPFLIVVVLLSSTNVACSTAEQSSDLPTVQASMYGIPGEGNVLAVGMLDTIRYMNGTVRGAIPSSFIYGDANMENFMLAWPMNGQWGFFGISKAGQPMDILKTVGNRASVTTFTDLVNGLTEEGWSVKSAEELPSWLQVAVSTTAAFMRQFGEFITMPMIIIMPPASNFEPELIIN